MRISDWSSDVCSSDRVDDRPLRKLWEGPIINSLLASNVCENLSSVGIEITGAGGANVKVRGNYLAGMEEPDPADTSIHQMQTRSEEHTSELQSLMRNSYAVFCLKKNKKCKTPNTNHHTEYHYDK